VPMSREGNSKEMGRKIQDSTQSVRFKKVKKNLEKKLEQWVHIGGGFAKQWGTSKITAKPKRLAACSRTGEQRERDTT